MPLINLKPFFHKQPTTLLSPFFFSSQDGNSFFRNFCDPSLHPLTVFLSSKVKCLWIFPPRIINASIIIAQEGRRYHQLILAFMDLYLVTFAQERKVLPGDSKTLDSFVVI